MNGSWCPPKPKFVARTAYNTIRRYPKYHKQHQAAIARRILHYSQKRRLYQFKRALFSKRREDAVKRLKSNPKAYYANKRFWNYIKWQHRYKRKAQGDKFWRFAKDY